MRVLTVCTALVLLAACASSEDKAIAACEAALTEKAEGKTYSIDRAALKVLSSKDAAGEVDVSGAVLFDPGLPREAKMQFECKTRTAEGKSEPDVISFSLVWN